MPLALKEIWDTPRIRAEANSIENNLRKTTRKLMILERQYRLKKMELLARMEAYEERLKWLGPGINWVCTNIMDCATPAANWQKQFQNICSDALSGRIRKRNLMGGITEG
jgi:hypothetical protein